MSETGRKLRQVLQQNNQYWFT